MQNMIFSYKKEYLETLKQTNKDIFCEACDYPLEYPVRCKKYNKLICNRCINDERHICDSTHNENTYSINGDHLIEPKLANVIVNCAGNHANGCTWVGKRSDYITHYEKCKENYINCPFCLTTISKTNITHECTKSNEWLESENNSNFAYFIKKLNDNSAQKDINRQNFFKNKLSNIIIDSCNLEIDERIVNCVSSLFLIVIITLFFFLEEFLVKDTDKIITSTQKYVHIFSSGLIIFPLIVFRLLFVLMLGELLANLPNNGREFRKVIDNCLIDSNRSDLKKKMIVYSYCVAVRILVDVICIIFSCNSFYYLEISLYLTIPRSIITLVCLSVMLCQDVVTMCKIGTGLTYIDLIY